MSAHKHVGWSLASVALLAVGASVCLLFPGGSGSGSLMPRQMPGGDARASELLGNLPLAFEPNVGQIEAVEAARAAYVARGPGYMLFLTTDSAVFAPVTQTEAAIKMHFADARAGVRPVGTDLLPGKSNYFSGSDPQTWRTGVPNYARVEYRDIYPGIDLVFRGTRRGLEYDWRIREFATLNWPLSII